jgi:cation:H+ antiporter
MGMVDWGLMIGSAILLLILATTGKRLSRWEGALLFAGYVAYVVYLLQ